jgi:hypothetical protein
MAVTAYAASGQLALSAFRTTVVGPSDSVSMSKLVARTTTTSTTTTDIQYTGTNVTWATGLGTNNSIPVRTTGAPTPAIAISDLHGAVPWFWTRRTNTASYSAPVTSSYYDDNDKSTVFRYGLRLTWDNVLVYTADDLVSGYWYSTPSTVTTGGFTYYRGAYVQNVSLGLVSGVAYYRIGRD